ncbi:MAG: lipocalin family protein [Leadbetterella sp.]
MKKSLLQFTFVLFSFLILFSCSEQDPTPNIIGKWVLSEVEYDVIEDGEEDSYKESKEDIPEDLFLKFESNGKYSSNVEIIDGYYFDIDLIESSYSLKDDKLTLNVLSENEDEPWPFTYVVKQQGDKLFLSFEKNLYISNLKYLIKLYPDEEDDIKEYIETIEKYDAKYTFEKE